MGVTLATVQDEISRIQAEWAVRGKDDRDQCYHDAKALVRAHPEAFDDIKDHTLDVLVQLIDVLRGELEPPSDWQMPDDPGHHIDRVSTFILATFAPQHISGKIAVGAIPGVFEQGLGDIELDPNS